MLVMSRKPGEAIAIGDRIVVKVLEVSGGRVQLGIEAPRDLKVAVAEPGERREPERK